MKKKRILFFMVLFCFSILFCACEEQEEICIAQEEAAVREEAGMESETAVQSEAIWIDVCGAVKKPGVYKLQADSRVFEAVKAAGGFTKEADVQWLNQAALVADGEKIQIYTMEETAEMKAQGESSPDAGEVSSDNKEEASGKINLNTASLEELQRIPGIGQVRAQAILDYREESGKFQNVEEIQEVPGIKGKTFEKMEEYITVK